MDDKTRTELEAAAFRRLVEHLREHTDVQNIDLMNLAGFCRNCLSRWYREAAEAQGVKVTDPEAREIVYGMPYDDWRAKHQKDASPAQTAAFGPLNGIHTELNGVPLLKKIPAALPLLRFTTLFS